MHGDLLSLDDAASVLHQLSTQFGDIDGVLVLDKTQFCIGGEEGISVVEKRFLTFIYSQRFTQGI